MMSKVWAFRSYSGGVGQSSLVLHLGIAMARADVATSILGVGDSAAALSVLARNVQLGHGDLEKLGLIAVAPDEIEDRVLEARAQSEIVLVDCPGRDYNELNWCDHEVAVVCPSAVSVTATRNAVAQRDSKICVMANQVASGYHGQRLLQRFSSLCGATGSRTVDSLGVVPYSSLFASALDAGFGFPSWLSWTAVAKALSSTAGAIREFADDVTVAETFILASMRPEERSEAA